MPDTKLPERLPSGKTIRPKVIRAILRQTEKYDEAQRVLDEAKKIAEAELKSRK
jgi:hypothetical protein